MGRAPHKTFQGGPWRAEAGTSLAKYCHEEHELREAPYDFFFLRVPDFGGTVIQFIHLARNSKLESKPRTLPCEGKTTCLWAELTTLSGDAMVRGRKLSSRYFLPGGC